MNIFIKFHKDRTTFVDFLLIAKVLAVYFFISRRKIVIVIVFDFSNFWQTVFSKFVPYFCHLIGKSEWQLEKNNHKGLISNLVFQWNAPLLIESYQNSTNYITPETHLILYIFEIEGIHGAMDKTLVLQTRGHEIKSLCQRRWKCDVREGRLVYEKAVGKGGCVVEGRL